MKDHKRIVVKIGTKVITSKDMTLDNARMKDLVGQIAAVKARGIDVIVVTSGAIGAGMGLLGLKRRPVQLSELQAAAAIGQSHLMHLYGEYFKEKGYLAGQILLTQEDFNDRQRYVNIKRTIDNLLVYNAIPVINENDTVATDEIKCGDNDRLSGLVSDLCQAGKLIILTDVEGFLDGDGRVIHSVTDVTAGMLKLAGKASCDLGTGGMHTKVECARTASEAGIECVMANGRKKDVILKIIDGESIGTTFKRGKVRFVARKRWIAHTSKPKGKIVIDDGAMVALTEKDKSLLASGIAGVEGNFVSGDVVSISGKNGREVARGVANYSSAEIAKIKGLKSNKIKGVLGREGRDEIVHKDNLVIL